jgi:DUF1009 family protein
MRKTGQSQKVDMPTIGIDTIQQARDAGLSGIAIKAGGAQVLDLADVIRPADETGLFVVSMDLTA